MNPLEIDSPRVEYVIPTNCHLYCRPCGLEGLERRAWRKMVSGQDTLHCFHCGRSLGNLPKKISGLEQRSIKSRPDLHIEKRALIMQRDRSTCLMCGRKPEDEVILHLGHILSVEDCKRLNVPEWEWNADDNLCILCEECNLSQGKRSFEPAYLLARLLAARRLR